MFLVYSPYAHLRGISGWEEVGIGIGHVAVPAGDRAGGPHQIDDVGLDVFPGGDRIDLDRQADVRQDVDFERVRFGAVDAAGASDRLDQLAFAD
jgi:hypothetical protein